MKEKQTTKYSLAGLAALATIMVYLSCLQNDFLQWDDNIYILENPHIRSLSPVFFKWAFFDFYAGNWHPLTWMSHALDYAVWGLNPMGHHLTNTILHAINTFLVVLLSTRLLEAGNLSLIPLKVTPPPPAPPLKVRANSRPDGAEGRGSYDPMGAAGGSSDNSVLIAAVATGLLFGLHPLHVESVAWVSERKDLLCALFFILSIMSYMAYVTYGIYKKYILSLVFFILALLSKPMAVTLPVVLLILDWYPLRKIQSLKTARTAIVGKLPFIGLSLGSSILTLFAQGTGGAIKSTEFAPLPTRLLVAVKSLIAYLWKMVLPVDIVPFYPYPKEVSLVSLEYLSAIVLVVGITITCIVVARRQKLWLSAWGYYVIMLLPVLGIVQVGEQSMADRYTYLSTFGLFLLMGVMGAWVWARAARLERGSSIVKLFAVAVSAGLIISLSYLTFRQAGIWKNSIVLWSYVIEKEPKRVLSAYLNRGVAFEKIGRIDKAMADYDKAIAIDPLYFEAYNNRGVLYGQEGLFDKAIEYFNKSIDINPDYEDAYVNRGIAYALAGQYGRALEDFDKAISLDKNSAKAFLNRGSLHLRTGNKNLALSDFRKACELGSEDGCARSSM